MMYTPFLMMGTGSDSMDVVIRYAVAAFLGLLVAFLQRLPANNEEKVRLAGLSLGGLLLYGLLWGGVDTLGPAWARSLARHSVFGACGAGVAVAMGAALWAILHNTEQATDGMTIWQIWKARKTGPTRKVKKQQ